MVFHRLFHWSFLCSMSHLADTHSCHWYLYQMFVHFAIFTLFLTFAFDAKYSKWWSKNMILYFYGQRCYFSCYHQHKYRNSCVDGSKVDHLYWCLYLMICNWLLTDLNSSPAYSIELIEIAFILCLALTFGSCFKTGDEDSENRRDIPSLNRSKEIHSKIFLEIDLFYFYVFIHPTKYVSISSVFVDTNQMQTKNIHVISFLWDQRTWHSIDRTLLRPLMVWWCRDGHWTMIISPWRGWEKWWWKLADTWH